jgi:hypothetical protein
MPVVFPMVPGADGVIETVGEALLPPDFSGTVESATSLQF